MVIGKCTDVFRGIFFGLGGGVVEGGIRGRIFPCRNLSWGKRILMKRVQGFLALFKKKTLKNKYEKFFQLKFDSFFLLYFAKQ